MLVALHFLELRIHDVSPKEPEDPADAPPPPPAEDADAPPAWAAEE
jgi:hypothetical protein